MNEYFVNDSFIDSTLYFNHKLFIFVSEASNITLGYWGGGQKGQTGLMSFMNDL